MGRPPARLHSLERFFSKLLTAEAPILEKWFVGTLFDCLRTARFHPELELGAPSRTIARDAMRAQQPIDAHPRWAVFARGGIPTQAAPGIGRETLVRFHKPGSDRIKVHIITDRLEITIAAAVDQRRFISPAKDVTGHLVTAIESNRVSAQEPTHPLDQVCFRGLDDQMKMILHETICMHLPGGLLARFGQRFEEILAIHVVQVNILAPITPAHYVVNR